MTDGANDNEKGAGKPKRATRGCAICEKPVERAYFPFCSKRCADLDLHRWLKGSYAIPAAEEDDPDDDDMFRPEG